MMSLKVISGGQTGADQGGLQGAQDAGIPTGGFAPYKFLTEKGSDYSLRNKYGLQDSFKGYAERTVINAALADVTFQFGDANSAGGKSTRNGCTKANKPFIIATDWPAAKLAAYIKETNTQIINIAGNRESHKPGLQAATRKIVGDTLKLLLTEAKP